MPSLGSGLECQGVEGARKEPPQSASGGRQRRRRGVEGSRDSLIHYSSDLPRSVGNGGGSLFSSPASSVAGLCSFGSDHDRGFPVSPLAGRERSGSSPATGPAQDSRPCSSPCHRLSSSNPYSEPPEGFGQTEEVAVEEVDEVVDVVDEEEQAASLHPSNRSSFQALEECQNQLCRSEAVALPGRKPRRRRPASLDFHGQSADVSVLSPRYFVGGFIRMKSSAASSRSRSGTLVSPGTPSYLHSTGTTAYHKGWSSERVPLPGHSNRRYVGSGLLLPFANGRTLPSKWEDAERWIFSPVYADGVGRSSVPPSHHRRPKSKSGPLGAASAGSGDYSSASPLVPCSDTDRVENFIGNSPFLAGVLMPDRGFCGSGSRGTGNSAGGGGAGVGGGVLDGNVHSADGENYIVRSASIHGWSDTLMESSSSVLSSQDEKYEGTRETTSMASPSVLMKDVATQMSPDRSTTSSAKERPLSPSSASTPAIEELETHFSSLEVRDVQIDDRVTVTRWSKKQIARGHDRRSASIIEWKKKTVEANTIAWEVSETSKSMSKYKREEAKITAWENLQKAKAEAEIRKLEMTLEKKRSSSMEKILSKLRSAEKKAQEMRSTMTPDQTNQVANTTKKVSRFHKKGQISSLSGCFTCHAF